ncbi:MAG: hypothetical protein E7680_00100 [Ruminococcaceae bacterium]|nr:hypothetical protein [Oscillospiraceae bacterium]
MKKFLCSCFPVLLIFALLLSSCGLLPFFKQEKQGKTLVSLADLPGYSGEAYAEINGNAPYFTDAEKTAARNSYETYAELDRLGRCGVCIASVGKDLMPTEARGSIGNVKPTGWPEKVEDAKYDIVDGKYLYNRCHLIGFQLTGENANKQNLITGTRYLNVDGMLPFENMVADYVKETGNHVLYRVTPLFNGSDLVALGVLMEAYSIEDGGKGISFCVFCYNVQPGIVIDYATGNSRLAKEGENLMPNWGSRVPSGEPNSDDQQHPDPDQSQPSALVLFQGSQPVVQGEKATVKVKGIPGKSYSIHVKLPSGSYSGASALKDPKTADDEGIVEWVWMISSNTEAGTATVTVTGDDEVLEFTFSITAKSTDE